MSYPKEKTPHRIYSYMRCGVLFDCRKTGVSDYLRKIYDMIDAYDKIRYYLQPACSVDKDEHMPDIPSAALHPQRCSRIRDTAT